MVVFRAHIGLMQRLSTNFVKKWKMINSILQKYLIPKDEFIYGFADLKGLLDKKFEGFEYGISIGKKLDDAIVDKLKDGPTLEYLEHYKQINIELADVSQKIGIELSEKGIDTIVFPPTISLGSKEYEKYLDKLSYDISHKMVATRAGLGWIGKTDLLISKKFGPRLRLTTILINKNHGILSKPENKSKCGSCTICVEKCPAKAAN
jgi:epoxyqueuosine reductase